MDCLSVRLLLRRLMPARLTEAVDTTPIDVVSHINGKQTLMVGNMAFVPNELCL